MTAAKNERWILALPRIEAYQPLGSEWINRGVDSRIRGLGFTGTSTTMNWDKEPFVLVTRQNIDIVLVQVADALLCLTKKNAHGSDRK
jgi:hypothetical protein